MAITGRTSTSATLFYGPNPNNYVSDITIPANTNLTILWSEGSFFYVEVTYNGLRRNYIESDYALVEFTETGATKKKRGWFEHMKLSTAQPTPQIYTDGHVFNNLGEKWKVTNKWNGADGGIVGHLGIDIVRQNSIGGNVPGKDVYAIASGTVVCSELGNGNGMIIQHTTSVGNVYYSMYCHLASRYYGINTAVSAGDAIGVMGNTGNSNGEHLHINITKANKGAGTYGYNYDSNGVKQSFCNSAGYPNYHDTVNINNQPWMDTRYYNPTQYFSSGESLINNYYN